MNRRAVIAAVTAAIVVLGVVLVLARQGDDEQAAPTTSTTTTSSTVASTTSSTATASTPTSAASGCNTVGVPDDAADRVDLVGDVDGDDAADQLHSYRLGDVWHLQVELAAGGGADLPIDSFGDAVRLVGPFDLDGDGADEVWAHTGSGASAEILGIVRFADCALAQVGFAEGSPAELPVGGSVGSAAGVACSPGDGADLVIYAASSADGSSYDLVASSYTLEGHLLVAAGEERSTVGADSAEFARATSFSCGTLSL
jgi:hypothetical protein